MRFANFPARAAALLAAALVAACGGGGSPGDTRTDFTPPPIQPVIGPGQVPDVPQSAGAGRRHACRPPPTRTPTRTTAPIDPQNERDTLAKWKAKNGFETGTGQEITVVFGDQRDLGYGRRMNARRNPDGTLAFYVENYLVRTGRRLRVLEPEPRGGDRARRARIHRHQRDRVQPRPQRRRAVRRSGTTSAPPPASAPRRWTSTAAA